MEKYECSIFFHTIIEFAEEKEQKDIIDLKESLDDLEEASRAPID